MPQLKVRPPALAPAAMVGAAMLLSMQLRGAESIQFYRERQDEGYFVRLSGRALFNVGVEVETVRPVYTDGQYGNGYVLPDIGGSDLTWNWGYDSDEQWDAGSDALTYERYEDLPPLGTQDESAVAPGGEVLAGLELGSFELGKRSVRFGVELGYGFNYLSVDTSASGSGNVTYTTAAYDLNGVVPPGAPYAGTPEGPGPLIGVMPASLASVTSLANTSYSGELDAGLHNFKLGVWFDYPVSDALVTSLSVGYASLYADSQFSFTETMTDPDRVTRATVGGRGDWNPGFYAQWRFIYQVSRRMDVFLGLDYQWNDKLSFSGADRNVTLDFTAMFGGSLGLQLNF